MWQHAASVAVRCADIAAALLVGALQVGGLQRLHDCGERLTVQASKVSEKSCSLSNCKLSANIMQQMQDMQ
jgi:hypothetical protein